ncbi:MAG: hypothetical protein AAFO94_21470, partial [Bacteroidota bacterium]
MTDPATNAYKQDLWSQFKQKIEQDWVEKYGAFKKDEVYFPEGVSIKFAKAVRDDMAQTFLNNGLDLSPLNHQTLYNYFHADDLPKNVKLGTLDTIACYLDYDGWSGFRQINGVTAGLPPAAPDKTSSVAASRAGKRPGLLYL